MKHHVAQTGNGVPVYVDLISSLAAKRIAHQPSLLMLVKEVLPKKKPNDAIAVIEHDMRRNIGQDTIVDTTDQDTVFYARLLQDEVYTRFVKRSRVDTTQFLTIILHLDRDKSAYTLHDIWIGKYTPPRPGSTNESAESKPYWEKHAFIFNSQPLKAGTTTKECPY